MNEELSIILKAKDEASKVIEDAGKKAKATFADISKTVGTAMTVAGGTITASLGLAIKAAAESESAWAKIGQQIKLSGLDIESTTKELQKFAGQIQSTTGYSDEYVGAIAGRLLPNVKDVGEAMKLTKMALDMEAAGLMDATAATKLLALAKEGDIDMLKRYVPELKVMDSETLKAMTTTERYELAMKALGSQVGGVAEVAGSTATGQLTILKETFGDLQEEIGNVLIPILTDLTKKALEVVNRVIDWTKKNPELTANIVKFAAALGAVMAVLGPILVILPGLVTALGLLLSPVGLITVAILALVAAGVALWMNWDTVKAKAVEIWTAVKDFFAAIWEDIKNIFGMAIDHIMGKINPFLEAAQKAISAAKSVGSAIGGAASKVGNTISNAIPKFAEGGIVTRPTLAMVGEGGEPEAIIPFSKMGRLAGAGGGNITVNINGGNYLDRDAARKLGNEIVAMLKLNRAI